MDFSFGVWVWRGGSVGFCGFVLWVWAWVLVMVCGLWPWVMGGLGRLGLIFCIYGGFVGMG